MDGVIYGSQLQLNPDKLAKMPTLKIIGKKMAIVSQDLKMFFLELAVMIDCIANSVFFQMIL